MIKFIDGLLEIELEKYRNSYTGRLYSFDPCKRVEVKEAADILKLEAHSKCAVRELEGFKRRVRRLIVVKKLLKRAGLKNG